MPILTKFDYDDIKSEAPATTFAIKRAFELGKKYLDDDIWVWYNVMREELNIVVGGTRQEAIDVIMDSVKIIPGENVLGTVEQIKQINLTTYGIIDRDIYKW